MEEAKEGEAKAGEASGAPVPAVPEAADVPSAAGRLDLLKSRLLDLRGKLPALLRQPKVRMIAGSVLLALVIAVGGIAYWVNASAKKAAKAKEVAAAKAKAKAEQEAKAAEQKAEPAMAPADIVKAHEAILAATREKAAQDKVVQEKAARPVEAKTIDAPKPEPQPEPSNRTAETKAQDKSATPAASPVAPEKPQGPLPRPSVANTPAPPDVPSTTGAVAKPAAPASAGGASSAANTAAGACTLSGREADYAKSLGRCLEEFNRMEGRR